MVTNANQRKWRQIRTSAASLSFVIVRRRRRRNCDVSYFLAGNDRSNSPSANTKQTEQPKNTQTNKDTSRHFWSSWGINFKFPPHPHQKYKNLTVWRTWLFIACRDDRWPCLPILTTSLNTLIFKRLGECTFWTRSKYSQLLRGCLAARGSLVYRRRPGNERNNTLLDLNQVKTMTADRWNPGPGPSTRNNNNNNNAKNVSYMGLEK